MRTLLAVLCISPKQPQQKPGGGPRNGRNGGSWRSSLAFAGCCDNFMQRGKLASTHTRPFKNPRLLRPRLSWYNCPRFARHPAVPKVALPEEHLPEIALAGHDREARRAVRVARPTTAPTATAATAGRAAPASGAAPSTGASTGASLARTHSHSLTRTSAWASARPRLSLPAPAPPAPPAAARTRSPSPAPPSTSPTRPRSHAAA